MEPNGNVSILKSPTSPVGESSVGRKPRHRSSHHRRWLGSFPFLREGVPMSIGTEGSENDQAIQKTECTSVGLCPKPQFLFCLDAKRNQKKSRLTMLWLENDGSVTPRKPTPILSTGSSNRVFLASAFAVSFPCFPKPNPRRPTKFARLEAHFTPFQKSGIKKY